MRIVSLTLFACFSLSVSAQNSSAVISGIVLDEVTNEPIVDARVIETDENAMLSVPKNWEQSKGNAGVRHQFRKVEHLDMVDNVNAGDEMKEWTPQDGMSGAPMGYSIIGSDSKKMAWINERAPKDYVCGYVLVSPYGSLFYSIFLVKDKNKYTLVYNERDKTETRSISSGLAKDMETLVNSRFVPDDAPKPVHNPINLDGLDEVVMVYEGFTAFAVIPDKAASFWTNYSKEVPDKVWQEEINKFIQCHP